MPYNLNVKCPCCDKTVNNDLNKIEELFGFRTMENGNKIPQSYCKVCRSKKCSPADKRC